MKAVLQTLLTLAVTAVFATAAHAQLAVDIAKTAQAARQEKEVKTYRRIPANVPWSSVKAPFSFLLPPGPIEFGKPSFGFGGSSQPFFSGTVNGRIIACRARLKQSRKFPEGKDVLKLNVPREGFQLNLTKDGAIRGESVRDTEVLIIPVTGSEFIDEIQCNSTERISYEDFRSIFAVTDDSGIQGHQYQEEPMAAPSVEAAQQQVGGHV